MILYFENCKMDEDGVQIDISNSIEDELYLWHARNGKIMGKTPKLAGRPCVVLNLTELKKMATERLKLKTAWHADFEKDKNAFTSKWANIIRVNLSNKTAATISKDVPMPISAQKPMSTATRL